MRDLQKTIDAAGYAQVRKRGKTVVEQYMSLGMVLLAFLLVGGVVLTTVNRGNILAKNPSRPLLHRNDILGALFEHSNFLAAILDHTGRLLEINEKGIAVLARPRNEIINQYFSDTYKSMDFANRTRLESSIRASRNGESSTIEIVYPTILGTNVNILLNTLPIQVGEERYIAILGADITALKKSETKFRQREQALQDSIEKEKLFQALVQTVGVMHAKTH